MVYELLEDDFFLRRHLEFFPLAPMTLRQVEVWRVGLDGQCLDQEMGPLPSASKKQNPFRYRPVHPRIDGKN